MRVPFSVRILLISFKIAGRFRLIKTLVTTYFSDRKHDWGAADLEKVTDYAEEKEIVAASTALLDDAIATVRKLFTKIWAEIHQALQSHFSLLTEFKLELNK